MDKRSKIVVSGLLRNATGLGEGARLCADALLRIGYSVGTLDLTEGLGITANLHYQVEDDKNIQPGTLILHLNPPLLPLARLLIGRRKLKNCLTVGYWAWELPKLPDSWCSMFSNVHEIWVPSRFAAKAVMAKTSQPVRVVPHPVVRPRITQLDRSAFGLPPHVKLVLTMCNLSSGFQRKNPIDSIKAFRHAFDHVDNVHLVVKVQRDAILPWAEEMLRDAIHGASNITILDAVLSQQDQHSLIASVDCVLSLHRAEGFGITLAQAMFLGKTVIATGWSGNVDFMDQESSFLTDYKLVPVVDPQGIYAQDQYWADPDWLQASRFLKLALLNDDAFNKRAAAAVKKINHHVGLRSYEKAVSPALGQKT